MDRDKNKITINTPDTGYESFPVSIMNRSTYEVATFDPAAGETARISYRLNKAGCIRLRLVDREQQALLIRTLQDWTDQEFGEYEIRWDGRDASGNIVDNKRMLVLFEAKDQNRGLQHQNHDKAICFDPGMSIRLTPDSFQPAKGTIEVQMSLQEKAHGLENNRDIKITYYINYKLIKTESFPPSTNEFVNTIETTSLENGEYLLTVNVDDSHDHIGSAGVTFTVENQFGFDNSDRVIVLGEDHTLIADGKTSEVLRNSSLLLKVNLIHEHSYRYGNILHNHPHSHLRDHEHTHDAPDEHAGISISIDTELKQRIMGAIYSGLTSCDGYVFITNDVFGNNAGDCAIVGVNRLCGALIITARGNFLIRVRTLLDTCLSCLPDNMEGVSAELAEEIIAICSSEFQNAPFFKENPLPFLLLLVGYTKEYTGRLEYIFIRNRVVRKVENGNKTEYMTEFDRKEPVAAANLFYGHSELIEFLSLYLPTDEFDLEMMKLHAFFSMFEARKIDGSLFPGKRLATLSRQDGFQWVSEDELAGLDRKARKVDTLFTGEVKKW